MFVQRVSLRIIHMHNRNYPRSISGPRFPRLVGLLLAFFSGNMRNGHPLQAEILESRLSHGLVALTDWSDTFGHFWVSYSWEANLHLCQVWKTGCNLKGKVSYVFSGQFLGKLDIVVGNGTDGIHRRDKAVGGNCKSILVKNIIGTGQPSVRVRGEDRGLGTEGRLLPHHGGVWSAWCGRA